MEKVKNLVDTKKFMGFVNSLLHQWGVTIKRKQKSILTKDGKYNTISQYILQYMDGIDKYI